MRAFCFESLTRVVFAQAYEPKRRVRLVGGRVRFLAHDPSTYTRTCVARSVIVSATKQAQGAELKPSTADIRHFHAASQRGQVHPLLIVPLLRITTHKARSSHFRITIASSTPKFSDRLLNLKIGVTRT